MTVIVPTLPQLAQSFGTDKLQHGYLPYYEAHFAEMRSLTASLLEIGIASGASLRMWREYFSRAEIWGLDAVDKSALAQERIHVRIGDQADATVLASLVRDAGGFDIIIDDGSHVSADVKASFALLFPALREGGWYVIEDLHASYWSAYSSAAELASGATTTGMIKDLIDGLNSHWIPGHTEKSTDNAVVAVHCYAKIAFVRKGRPAHELRPYEQRMIEETLAQRSIT